jgi:hypothetical protein
MSKDNKIQSRYIQDTYLALTKSKRTRDSLALALPPQIHRSLHFALPAICRCFSSRSCCRFVTTSAADLEAAPRSLKQPARVAASSGAAPRGCRGRATCDAPPPCATPRTSVETGAVVRSSHLQAQQSLPQALIPLLCRLQGDARSGLFAGAAFACSGPTWPTTTLAMLNLRRPPASELNAAPRDAASLELGWSAH